VNSTLTTVIYGAFIDLAVIVWPASQTIVDIHRTRAQVRIAEARARIAEAKAKGAGQ
jgi:hypothetical protein